MPSSAILQKRTLCCTAAGVCLFQAEGILFPFSFSLPYSGGSRLARRNFKDNKERAGKTVDQQTTVFQALRNFFQFSSEFPRVLTQQRSRSSYPCHHVNWPVALNSFPAIHWQFLNVFFQEVSALTFAKLLSSLRNVISAALP